MLAFDSAVLLQAVFSGLLEAGLLAAVAIGLALVFGVMGVVNFAHGALLMAATYGALLLGRWTSAWVSSLLLFMVMAAVGAVVYRALIRPAYHLDHTFHLLITLGLALVLENAALLIFGAEPASLAGSGVEGSLSVLGASLPINRVILCGIGIAASVGLYVFLTRTDLGHQIRAASQDTAAAELSGIPVQRVMALSMALGVAVLGMVAPWVLATSSATPTSGDSFVLLAFVVVILGGLGSVRGAMLAAVVVGLTESLGVAYLPGTLGLSAVWILFILVLLFRPQGILVGRT